MSGVLSRDCNNGRACSLTKYAVLLILCLTQLGCNSLLVSQPPEERVRELSEQWLALMLKGDYKEAYKLTTPGYQATHSARDHGRSYAGVAMWRKAEISKVNCGADEVATRCVATMMVTYKAIRGGFLNTRPLELIWIGTSDGRWGLYSD